MLNNINKFLPPRQYRLPLLGLLLILGVVGERAKPVLSNQLARLHTPISQEFSNQIKTYTWLERTSAPKSTNNDKETRLRRALVKSSSVSGRVGIEGKIASTQQLPNSQVKSYTWLQRNYRYNQELGMVTADKKPQKIATPKTSIKTAGVGAKAKFPKQNGVYLYGQSPQPGQSGQGYIVFEKRQNQIVGAMYMPNSEYNCFKGTLKSSGELAMTVRGYAGDIGPSQVATVNGVLRKNEDEPVIYGHSLALQDYYKLDSVGRSDRQILQMCRTNQ